MGTVRCLCLGLSLVACGEVKGSRPPDAAPMRDLVATLPATLTPDIDILFVVDDSNSMLDHQQDLANNFPVFINRLQSQPGGLPNLHLGVVTTDMGTKGSGNPTPGPGIGQVGQGGCTGTGKDGKLQTFGAPVTGAFLSDIRQTDGTRQTNYTGDLASTFAMMTKAGATGCGFEQPLQAMRRALDNNPANAGFLRANAALAVVFLTDEDDCTATDPKLFSTDPTLGPLASFRCTRFGVTCNVGGATPDAMNTVGTKSGCGANATSTLLDDVVPYADFLKSLKSDPSRVVVGAIMGPSDPFSIELVAPPGGGTPVPTLAHSCSFQGPTGGLEVADPAARMSQFLAQFPDRANLTTICQQDFSIALDQTATLATQAIGNPCLTKFVTDTDPATPGTQADCIVTARSGAQTTELPPCPAAGPCWRIQQGDFATCPALDGSKLVVEGAAGFSPDTVFEARCVTDGMKQPPLPD